MADRWEQIATPFEWGQKFLVKTRRLRAQYAALKERCDKDRLNMAEKLRKGKDVSADEWKTYQENDAKRSELMERIDEWFKYYGR